MKVSRMYFDSSDGVEIEGFLYEPGYKKSIKGVILFLGGSGFTRGGFGGPSAFSRLAQAEGYVSFEWNKRGIRSNEGLTDILIDRQIYSSTVMEVLVQDAESALSFMKRKFPNNPIFVFGGSEGSYVATLLAERRAQDITAIAIFGTGVAPFLQVIEHQIASRPILNFCCKNRLTADHQFAPEDLQAIAKANPDFSPVVEALLLRSGTKTITVSELSQEMVRYYLLDLPDRDDYWYRTSATPTGFFEAMVQVPSLFERLDRISIPFLILHGVRDESSPIQSVYQLETVCRLKKISHVQFRFYSEVGHAPTADMLKDGISFFQNPRRT